MPDTNFSILSEMDRLDMRALLLYCVEKVSFGIFWKLSKKKSNDNVGLYIFKSK